MHVNKVFRAGQAGVDVLLADGLFGIGRPGAIKWDIATLRRDDDLVAADTPRLKERVQCDADAAFAALEAIVDGRVDDVDAARDGMFHRRYVAGIGLRVWLTEISADADRLQPPTLLLPEVAGQIGEPVAVALCALRRCATCGMAVHALCLSPGEGGPTLAKRKSL